MTSEQLNPYGDRPAKLREMVPHLVAHVRLYATVDGGRGAPAYPGWGPVCMISKEKPLSGYSGWPILDEPLKPGEDRAKVGFVFLVPEGADALRSAGRFYLWEGRFVGEAAVK